MSLTKATSFFVTGTTTNDNALAGSIGEYITSSNGAIGSPGTGQYFDMTSISLTPGDWDISALVGSGGGNAVTLFGAGTYETPGNSTTGLFLGDNFAYTAPPTATYDTNVSIPRFRASLSVTTIYYLKCRVSFTTTTPVSYGRISARRVR